MWGDFLRNAAAQAQTIVGKVDELTSKGLEQATSLLETLDGLGDENQNGEGNENDQPDDAESGEKNDEIFSDGESSSKVEDNGTSVTSTKREEDGWDWGNEEVVFSDDDHRQVTNVMVGNTKLHINELKVEESNSKDREESVIANDLLAEKILSTDPLDYPKEHVDSTTVDSSLVHLANFNVASTPSESSDLASTREKKLQRAYKKLEKDKLKLQEDLTRMVAENQSLSQTVSALQADIIEAKKALVVNQKDWEDEREGLMQTIHEFQRILHGEEAKRQDSEKIAKEIEEQKNQLQKQVLELDELLQSTRSEYDIICDRYAELEQNGITELEIVKRQLEESLGEIQVLRANQSQPESPRLMQSPVTAPAVGLDTSILITLQSCIEDLKKELDATRQSAALSNEMYEQDIISWKETVVRKLQHELIAYEESSKSALSNLSIVENLLQETQNKQKDAEALSEEWKLKCQQSLDRSKYLEEEHEKAQVELLTKHKTVLEQMKKFKQSYRNQEKQLKDLQDQNDGLLKRISFLESEVASAVAQNNIVGSKDSSSSEKVDSQEQLLILSNERIALIEEQLLVLEEQRSTSSRELEVARVELKNCHQLQEELRLLKTKYEAVEAEKSQLQEHQAQLIAERNSFEGSLKYLNELFKEQEEELNRVKETMESEKQSHLEKLDQLEISSNERAQANQTVYSIELERLENMLRDKLQENEELQIKLHMLSKAIDGKLSIDSSDIQIKPLSATEPELLEYVACLDPLEPQPIVNSLTIEKDALLVENRAFIEKIKMLENEMLHNVANNDILVEDLNSTIRKLQLDIDERNQILSEREAVERSSQQKWSLQQEQYEQQQNQLQHAINVLKLEKETDAEKILFLQRQCSEKEKELTANIAELEALANIHAEEQCKLKESLESKQRALELLNQSLSEANSSLEDASKRLLTVEDLHTTKLELLNRRIESLEDSIATNAQENDAKKIEYDKQLADVNRLKDELLEKVQFLQFECISKDEAMALKLEEIEKLSNSRESAEDLINSLQKLLAEKDILLNNLNVKIDEFERWNKQETDHVQHLKEMELHVGELQQSLDEMKILVDKKDQALVNSERMCVDLRQDIYDLQQNQLLLQNELNQVRVVAEENLRHAESSKKELSALQYDCEVLREGLTEKTISIAQMIDEKVVMNAKLSLMEDEQFKLLQDLAHCRARLDEKDHVIEQSQLDLSVSKISCDQLNHQFQEQQEELRRLKKFIEQSKLNQLEVEEKIQSLQMELSIKIEEINTLYSLNRTVQNEKDSQANQFQLQCEQLTQLVHSLELRTEQLTTESITWKNKCENLHIVNIELQKQFDSQNEKIKHLTSFQEQHDALQENVRKMELKKKKDLEFLRKSNENISHLQNEVNSWKQKYHEELRNVTLQHEEVIDNLNHEIQSLRKSVGELDTKRQILQDQINQNAASVFSHDGSSSPSVSSSFCLVNEDISPVTPALAQSEQTGQKVSTLVDATVAHHDTETNTGEYLDSLLHEISVLKDTVLQRDKEIAKHDDETKALQQMISTLQRKVHEIESHCNLITHQNQQYQKDVKVLEDSLLQSAMSTGSPLSSSSNSTTVPMQRQSRNPTTLMNVNGMSSITGDLVTDVESANGLVSASPTSIDVEKKELAGNHVLMIKIWELIRLGNTRRAYFRQLVIDPHALEQRVK